MGCRTPQNLAGTSQILNKSGMDRTFQKQKHPVFMGPTHWDTYLMVIAAEKLHACPWSSRNQRVSGPMQRANITHPSTLMRNWCNALVSCKLTCCFQAGPPCSFFNWGLPGSAWLGIVYSKETNQSGQPLGFPLLKSAMKEPGNLPRQNPVLHLLATSNNRSFYELLQ